MKGIITSGYMKITNNRRKNVAFCELLEEEGMRIVPLPPSKAVKLLKLRMLMGVATHWLHEYQYRR